MRQVAWIVLAAIVVVGCGGQDQSSDPVAAESAPVPTPTTAPAPPPQSEDQTVYVLMTTNKGEIVLALDAEKAPTTVANFVEYANSDFYDGTIFHRVMENFMIQGGGFNQDMQKKQTGAPIENEWTNGLKNGRGTIAMARTSDPNSATAQFFINVADNPALDEPRSGGAGYAVFGAVVAGMDVVDTIKTVETGVKKGMSDVPIDLVVIEQVNVISADDAQKLIDAGG